ncbi:MAG TPA: hypothetical protein DCM54_15490 [Gammaproteobacteria bacterium]|nr:hypothetical protein [Gammaproteobacteria bacterium]
MSYSSWFWGLFFVAFRRSAEIGEQDPEGLVEELMATGRVASHGEKQTPELAANTLDGAWVSGWSKIYISSTCFIMSN